MSFGLPDSLFANLVKAFSLHKSIAEVKIFGSRAIGNYRKGSDIDLCLFGNDLKYEEIKRIKMELEELITPYFIDVCHYERLDSNSLKDHTDRIGVELYCNELQKFV